MTTKGKIEFKYGILCGLLVVFFEMTNTPQVIVFLVALFLGMYAIGDYETLFIRKIGEKNVYKTTK